jgi:hypothetical protein
MYKPLPTRDRQITISKHDFKKINSVLLLYLSHVYLTLIYEYLAVYQINTFHTTEIKYFHFFPQ